MTSMPSAALLAVANSSALMTVLTDPAPVESSTFMPMRLHRGRDALEDAVRTADRAADEAGDVRPVTVVVVRRGRDPALREVVERGDAIAEISGRIDAGIEDGHANPCTLR